MGSGFPDIVIMLREAMAPPSRPQGSPGVDAGAAWLVVAASLP